MRPGVRTDFGRSILPIWKRICGRVIEKAKRLFALLVTDPFFADGWGCGSPRTHSTKPAAANWPNGRVGITTLVLQGSRAKLCALYRRPVDLEHVAGGSLKTKMMNITCFWRVRFLACVLGLQVMQGTLASTLHLDILWLGRWHPETAEKSGSGCFAWQLA